MRVKVSGKILFLRFTLMMLGYGFFITTYISLPIIFFRPELICKVKGQNGGIGFSCSEKEMCDNNYDFNFKQEFQWIQSLSMEKNFYCDQKIYESTMQSLPFLGQTLTFIYLLFVKIDSKDLYQTIVTNIRVVTIVMFIPLFTENLIVLSLIIFIQNIGYSIMITFAFQYARTFAPMEYKERAVAYVNLGYPIVSLFYVGFVYNFGNWKQTFIYFNGLQGVVLVLGFYLVGPTQEEIIQTLQDETGLQTNEYSEQLLVQFTNSEQLQEQSNFWYSSEIVRKDQGVRRKFNIWLLGFVAPTISYTGCMIALNSIGGNIIANMLFSTILELVGGILAQYLIEKVSPLKLSIGLCQIIGVSYLISLEAIGIHNNSINAETNFMMFIQMTPIIIGKISHEILYPFVLVLLEKYFPSNIQTFIMTLGNVVSLTVVSLMPYYKYFMTDIIQINQFFFYSIVFFLTAQSLNKLKGFQTNNQRPQEIELKQTQIFNNQQLEQDMITNQ